jgi:hypothetical protein
MTKPWARDASGEPVATSLSVEGSVVKMSVGHAAGTTNYPVVAHRQVSSSESVDEAQALRDDADTATYSNAELEEQEPPEPQEPGDATEPLGYDGAFQEPADWGGDPSAFDSTDDTTQGDGDAAVAEPNAALTTVEASRLANLRVGLTETDPAVLFSPDRLDLPTHRWIRPVVPWRVVQMHHPNTDPCSGECRTDRRRAEKWDRFYSLAKAPTPGAGQNCGSTSARNTHGRKTVQEQRCGVPTDIAIQEFDDTDGTEPPSPRRYKSALMAFFERYPRVTRNLAAWNEPQLGKHNTRDYPKRAARFWIAAQQACHPRGGPIRCKGHVIAGEFAGTANSVGYPRANPIGKYETAYRKYLLSQLPEYHRKKHQPRVWGFHAYEDVTRHELLRRQESSGPSRARLTPIIDRFHRQHEKGVYGDAQLWITAIGANYHIECPEAGRYPGYCPDVPDDVVLLGARRQFDGLRFLLRRIARYPEIKALYYYALHDVVNAASYSDAAAYVPPGRIPADFEGRCNSPGVPTGPCDRLDRGLVGSDADGTYEGDEEIDDKSSTPPRYHSARGGRRSAFCLLRYRSVSRSRCSAR